MTPADQNELILYRINELSGAVKTLSDKIDSLNNIGSAVNVLQVHYATIHSEVENLKKEVETLKASRWQVLGALSIIAIVWQFVAGGIQKALGM